MNLVLNAIIIVIFVCFFFSFTIYTVGSADAACTQDSDCFSAEGMTCTKTGNTLCECPSSAGFAIASAGDITCRKQT